MIRMHSSLHENGYYRFIVFSDAVIPLRLASYYISVMSVDKGQGRTDALDIAMGQT